MIPIQLEKGTNQKKVNISLLAKHYDLLASLG